MTLLAPAFLALSLLGLVIIVLHVQRRRTVPVSSLQIWRRLQGIKPVTVQRLHWPRPSLLLFLQIAAVVAGAVALAHPLFGPDRPPEHWVFVLDSSASMQVEDADGGSRFDAARARIEELAAAAGRPNLTSISLISAGPRAEAVVARRPYDGQEFGKVLESLQPTDGSTDWSAAGQLVSAVAQTSDRVRIILASDAPLASDLAGSLPEGVPVEESLFGAPGTNFALRAKVAPADPETESWTVSGEVTMFGGANDTMLTIRFAGQGAEEPLDWATVPINAPTTSGDPDTPVSRRFERKVELPGPGILTVELPDDGVAHDNVARFVLEDEPTTLDVLYLGSGEQPLVRALQAIAGVSVYTAAELPDSVARFGLVIVDDVAVPRQPENNVVWIARGRIAGQPEPAISESVDPVNWRSDHALSKGISWAHVNIGQGYSVPEWTNAQVLLESSTTPLIQARTGEFGREVRLAFSPAQSDWPANPSFPGFVWRLVSWTGVPPGLQVVPTCLVQAPCAVDARLIGGEVTPLAGTAPLSSSAMLRLTSELAFSPDGRFIPEHAGLYRVSRNGLQQVIAIDAPTDEESRPAVGQLASAAAAPPSEWPVSGWLIPAALLLLILLVEGYLAGRGQERFLRKVALARNNPLAGHRRLLLGLRLATLLFVAMALLNVPVPWLSEEENVVVATARPDAANPAATAFLDRVGQAGGNRDVPTVYLGMPPQILSPEDPASPADESPLPAAGADQALSIAAGMLAREQPGRIVLQSGPLVLASDVAGVIPELQARGIAVDYVPGAKATAADAAVQSVEAPLAVYSGDDFPLTAVVYSTTATNADIEVFRDGEPVGTQSSDLQVGYNRVDSLVTDVGEGVSTYELVVSAEGDTNPYNNRSGVAVNATLPGPVALVAQDLAQAEALAEALAEHGITGVPLSAEQAPFELGQWLKYRAVMLMNVPAIALDTNQQTLIETAVYEYGRGLLILGGPNSFGPGGYLQTPLDRMSPLSSSVPKEAPAVVLAFVLDRSGSMQQPIGNGTRLDIAKRATLSAIELLNKESQVSIIAFDEVAQTILPLQTVPERGELIRVLSGLSSGGGTSIYPGLVHAFRQLRDADAAAKHVVVMTDGLTQPADFEAIVQEMRAAGITVSTVALGASARRDMVEDIASWGGGAFHTTTDVRALPSILSQEAMMLAGAPVEEGTTLPQWVDRSPDFLTGFPETVPPIEGFVLTTARPQAKVAMVTPDASGEMQPLLAHWRLGNGRVLALTTDATGEWTRSWQAIETYPLFWSEVLREFLSANPSPGLQLAASRQGDEVAIGLEALDDDGAPLELASVVATVAGPGDDEAARRVTLVRTEPAHYRGSFVSTTPGNYTIRVTADDEEATFVTHVGYAASRSSVATDHAAALLAAATDGREIGPDEPLLHGGTWEWIAFEGWPWWLITALGLFMIDLVTRYGSPLGLLRSVAASRVGGNRARPAVTPGGNSELGGSR